jgi:P-type Cu2+ transporter
VAKVAGDLLVGGSLNLGGPVEMDVQRTGADTRYEAIVAMMREAATQRPALARLADRWAGPFVWIVLLLAAGAAAAWSVIDPSRAVWVAVSVLIVTCPCALSLAAPAALTAAAGGMARRGVLVQRLDAIEALARVRQLFIDKTGTLTEDRLQLREVQAFGRQLGRDEALARAAALAGWSQHPLSVALAATAPAAGGDAGWQDVQEPGQGLSARDAEGRAWRLGSAAWIGAALPAQAQAGLALRGRAAGRVQLRRAPARRGRRGHGRAARRRRARDAAVRRHPRACASVWPIGWGWTARCGGATPQAKLDAIAAGAGRRAARG